MQVKQFVVCGRVLKRSNKAVGMVYEGKMRFVRVKSVNVSAGGSGYISVHDIRKGLPRNFSIDKISSVSIH